MLQRINSRKPNDKCKKCNEKQMNKSEQQHEEYYTPEVSSSFDIKIQN